VITADISVAPNAVGGTVLIFVKNGSNVTKPNNDAFFFVQIPMSLNGTGSPFDQIPASGIGPLHTPVNQSVLFPDGTTQPNACGVYRFFALQLQDQDTPPQPIETSTLLQESFSRCTANDAASCPTPNPNVTNNDGVSLDFRALLSTFPTSPKPGDNAIFTQGFSVPIGNSTFNLTTTYQVTIGNFNGELKVDSLQKTP
jgi:hypothetical protein